MDEEEPVLTGIEGSKVAALLSKGMTRADWISFAKEFRIATVDNLVLWHVRHKRIPSGSALFRKIGARFKKEGTKKGDAEDN